MHKLATILHYRKLVLRLLRLKTLDGVDIFLGFVLAFRDRFFLPGNSLGRRQVKIIIDHSIAAIDEYVTGEGAAAGLVMDG